jgi:putative transposase
MDFGERIASFRFLLRASAIRGTVHGRVRRGVGGCGHRGGQDPAPLSSVNRLIAMLQRLVLTARTELTDRMLIFGARHLQKVLATYAAHYNTQRPHRALQLRPPRPESPVPDRAGARQDPVSTDPRRPDQRVRTRSLKPLIRCHGRVLEPDSAPRGAWNRVEV